MLFPKHGTDSDSSEYTWNWAFNKGLRVMRKVQHKTLEGLLLKSMAPNLLGPELPVSQKSSLTSLPWSLRPAEPSSDVKETALPSPRPTSHLTPCSERLTNLLPRHPSSSKETMSSKTRDYCDTMAQTTEVQVCQNDFPSIWIVFHSLLQSFL